MDVELLGPLRVRADGQEIDLGGPAQPCPRGAARPRRGTARRRHDPDRRPVGRSTCLPMRRTPCSRSSPAPGGASRLTRSPRRRPVTSCSAATVDAVESERLVADGRSTRLRWRCGAATPWPMSTVSRSRPRPSRRLGGAAARRPRVERCASGSDPVPTQPSSPSSPTSRLPTPTVTASGTLYLVGPGRRTAAPTEALAAYRPAARQLADELGADPSPELQELHLSILRGRAPSVGPGHPARLPSALTTFVGRDEAIADLQDARVDHRLVTILGPGGAGKTRLAVETARGAPTASRTSGSTELAPVTGGADGIPGGDPLGDGAARGVAVLDRPFVRSAAGRAYAPASTRVPTCEACCCSTTAST